MVIPIILSTVSDIWLDAEEGEESNDTKIVFIALSRIINVKFVANST